MTQQTDLERLDAIRQLCERRDAPMNWADVSWLLDRLAALEHEREALLKAFEVETVQEAIEEHEHETRASLKIAEDIKRAESWPPERWPSLNDRRLFKALFDRAEHADAALLSVEHERDEFQAAWTEAREIAERSIRKRQDAEAAFLSLQTAVRKLEFELRCVSREGMSHGTGVGNYEMRGASRAFWNTADRLAALLPDPAGTSSSPKTDEDDQARVDGEQLVDHPRTAPTERR